MSRLGQFYLNKIKMPHAFDHVCIGDVEFVLLFRLDEKRAGTCDGVRWCALDMYMNRVGISEADTCRLPSQCTWHGKWVETPRYYRERCVDSVWAREQVTHSKMAQAIRDGDTSGTFAADGKTWTWNTRTMEICCGDERWLLRVMTPGGVWL